jgi:hypothetical protein
LVRNSTAPPFIAGTLDSAALHRLHSHRDVAVSGDKDDGKLDVRVREVALEVEPAAPRQTHVEDEAGRRVRQVERLELGNRGEKHGMQTDGSQ